MGYLVWLVAGVIFAAALLLFTRARRIRGERRILSIALVLVAAVYIGFASAWGDGAWLAIEVAGVPAYGIFIWPASRYSF